MRRNVLRAAQWLFTGAVLIFAGVALAREWEKIGGRVAALRPDWVQLGLATALVLASYAVLIETWRRVLAAWDTRLPWWTAARIWFASSLAKYVPGNVWSIAALGMMARNRGASAVAAAGSSVLVNILNLAAGAAVVLLFAARLVPQPLIVGAIVAAVLAAAAAAPWLLPRATAVAARLTHRELRLPRIPSRIVWISLAGTTTAWLAYGVSFRLFAEALLGAHALHGPMLLYIAAYTGAYILGFITPVAPAGLGVREFALIEGLARLGLMSASDAAIVALASRLWLTVLEVAPGVVALLVTHATHRSSPRPHPAA